MTRQNQTPRTEGAAVTIVRLAAGFADVVVHEFIAGSLSRIAGTKAK
jgi:hypothetical protein